MSLDIYVISGGGTAVSSDGTHERIMLFYKGVT